MGLTSQSFQIPMRARSGSHELDVHLFAPIDYELQRLPAIIICHGFGGIKETTSPAIARIYAANSYAAFTFDCRGFGKSQGPRWEFDPKAECEDVMAMCGFVESQPFVDANRIGLHGSSFGGEVAVMAATHDQRVCSVVIVAAVTDGEK
jgi:dipeptidyl aminopeptidase/acylaminoacyl peptidase